jgi:hypothetical protein
MNFLESKTQAINNTQQTIKEREKYFSRFSLMVKAVFFMGIFLLISCGLLISQYAQALDPVQKGATVSITIEGDTPTPPGGGGSYVPPQTQSKVIFKGKAYPGAFVTILKDGAVAATLEVDATGYFSKFLSGLTPRIYAFGIWAEDVERRKSLTLNYSISLIGDTITTMEIFLPPTFEINKAEYAQGEDLIMTGKTFPLSNINILVSPNKLIRKTTADAKGNWSYKLNTADLEPGDHTCKVQSQTNDGEQSPFSQQLSFSIASPEPPSPEPPSPECQGADLNKDGEVNIFDFSILLYFWDSAALENICVDINQDKIVDLVDFSIMMYQWTD